MKLLYIIIGVILLAGFLYYYNSTLSKPQLSMAPTPSVSQKTVGFVLGARTKSSDCVISGPIQDHDCTPGAIFSDVTANQVCTSGYSKNVRNVPESEKNDVYAEYGITTHTTGQYEVDHLISLELGGSNDIANLWPEAANPTPGFHQKDKVENYLHQQVCAGKISLSTAQQEIANDWMSVYKTLPQ